MMVTPCSTTVSAALVSSQFPPRSLARSTITEPGAMLATMSLVTSSGGFFPGKDHGLIATNRGHRGKRVHALRARAARHQLHGQGSHAAGRDFPNGLNRA